MIKNNLVILPHDQPLSQVCDFARQTGQVLARSNNKIIYFSTQGLSLKKIFSDLFFKQKRFSYLKKRRNVFYLQKIEFFPFKRFDLIKYINLIINVIFLKIIAFFLSRNCKHKLIWIFQPKQTPLLKYFKKYFSIYDGIDYHFSFDKKTNKLIRQQEKLALKSKLVTSISHALAKVYQKKRKNVFIVPQGFALKDFSKYYRAKAQLKLPQNKPKIGFIGGINYRLDFELLFKLIRNNQNWNFIFIGPTQQYPEDKFIKTQVKIRKLFSPANSFHFSVQSRKNIIPLMKNFDLGLIPYDIKNPFNLYCYPMKVFEYFYIQKPVISTPILELKTLRPYVKIAQNSQDFEKEIRQTLKKGWPEKYKKEQRKLAMQNSWENKIEKISQILEKEKLLK